MLSRAHFSSGRRLLLPGLAMLGLLAVMVAGAGCANGSDTPNRDGGGSGRDGTTTSGPGACGAMTEACCAGGTCELGLRCTRDVCCIQAGSNTRCSSAADCCTGLACTGGICSTPRGGACSGSADCGSGLVCYMGVCSSPESGDVPPGCVGSTDPACVCGGMGGGCCTGFFCRSGLVCVGTTCEACGTAGAPCCDGATACTSTALTCGRDGSGTAVCVMIPNPEDACGTIDRPPCGDDGMPATDCTATSCEGDLRCVDAGGTATCLNPDDEGGMGQPCGPRGGCDGNLICTYGGPTPTCQPTPAGCGRDMEMCCDTGSTSGGTCEGALHCQTGGCTTCAGPSITCLLSGAVPGQECCNGAVCRPSPIVPRCCVAAGEACINAADCCGFMTCQDGTCRGTSEGGFCVTSVECGPGLTCLDFRCQPDTMVMCVEPNTACSGAGTCCDGTTCAPHYDVDNIVIPPEDRCCAAAGTSCTDSFDCCGQMLCTGGMCECQADMETCWSDADCCDGSQCLAGKCYPDTCPALNTSCTGVNFDCGLDCRPDTWADNPNMSAYQYCSGDICINREDCCGEMLCVDAHCVKRVLGESCAHDADCDGGLVCTAGTCAAP